MVDALSRRRADGLAVVEVGQGAPVLLLHGISSCADSFRHQIPVLAATRRVIAWDAPGYAYSDDPRAPLGMDGYADVAASLLDRLDAHPAHLVGVSWGGVVAVRLALRHPAHVRSLVLADSTRGSGGDQGRADAMRARGEQLESIGVAELARRRAPRLLSPSAPPGLIDEVARLMTTAIRLPGYAWAAASMADTDHGPSLGHVATATLVVAGEHDAVVPTGEPETLAARIPGARLAVVPEAGHLANQEQPDLFNDLVVGFLDDAEHAGPAPAMRDTGGVGS